MKIKKNDEILIIVGKDRGKTGKVEKVFPKKDKVVITGINIRKKHLKPSKKNPKSGIMEFPAPVDSSSVKLICPKCNKPTRVSFNKTEDGKKRECKRCKEIIPD